MFNKLSIDEVIEFSEYNSLLVNESIITNMLTKIKNKSYQIVIDMFKKSWMEAVKILQLSGKEEEAISIINSNFGTNFKSLDQIIKQKVYEDTLNEDLKHYWEMLKSEGFPTLSFYPALTAWIELGKLLEPDMAVNWKKVVVYAGFWLALVSGKFVKDFYKWKKENPEEYYAERPNKKEKEMAKLKKRMAELEG